jgi:hypothetical protein
MFQVMYDCYVLFQSGLVLCKLVKEQHIIAYWVQDIFFLHSVLVFRIYHIVLFLCSASLLHMKDKIVFHCLEKMKWLFTMYIVICCFLEVEESLTTGTPYLLLGNFLIAIDYPTTDMRMTRIFATFCQFQVNLDYTYNLVFKYF